MVLHCETNSNDRNKSEASEKRSATSVTKVFYICSMVVHCETNCIEICPMIEKNQRSRKKKRNKCNKGILYAVWWFIVKQTALYLKMFIQIIG